MVVLNTSESMSGNATPASMSLVSNKIFLPADTCGDVFISFSKTGYSPFRHKTIQRHVVFLRESLVRNL